MAEPSKKPTAADFARTPLPKRFCNLDRLLHAMEVRGLDGVVATQPNNVYYLTGFNGIAHKSDEPRPYAVDDLAPCAGASDPRCRRLLPSTFLAQPTWVEDIRPYRAVMMALDLPARRDRHRPV